MKPGNICGLISLPARAFGIQVSALTLCALLSVNALAINYPLQPEQIEEAYSLGRTSNHEDLVNFLNQYEHDFQYPSDHPLAYVRSVELQTPYEQIVLKSLRSVQYSKFKAEDDYRTSAGAIFVRVIVALRIGFAGHPPPEDSFKVAVSQSKPIEPAKMTSTVLCDPSDAFTYPVGSGACDTHTRELLLRFNQSQFAAGKATVKVMLPGGKFFEATYNLNVLK